MIFYNFADQSGKQQTLYIGNALQHSDRERSYALPPRAPAGYFDVRFTTDSRLAESTTASIAVQTGNSPVMLTLKTDEKRDPTYQVSWSKKGIIIGQASLRSEETLMLPIEADGLNVNLVSLESDEQSQPARLHIHGNYPNPFNPSTRIIFDLPADGEVGLEVYNMLGQKVLEIPETPFAAGSQRSIEVDASGLSTGMYVYRLIIQDEMGTNALSKTFNLVR